MSSVKNIMLRSRFTRVCYQKIYFFKLKIRNYIRKYKMLDRTYVLLTAFLHNKELKSFELCSAIDCCEEKQWDYRLIEEAKPRKICKPQYFENNKESIEVYWSPEIYMAEFYDVFVIREIGAVFTETKCIFDELINDEEDRYDARFSGLKYKEGDKVEVVLSKKIRNVKEAIFLTGFAPYNYYHLTVEILSRLSYADSVEKYRTLPILVDEIVLKIPQFEQLLRRINIYCHPIIAMDDTVVKVKRLIYPSKNTWMPISLKKSDMVKNSDYMIAETALYNIREKVKDLLPTEQGLKHNKKIFVSRRDAKNIRLENEREIRILFEQNGYEVIFAEDMTYEEQVICFSKAKCVVCATGAVLTNIIYCIPGTIIGCIMPEEYHFYLYSTIGYLMNLRNIYLNAEVTERTAYFSSNMFTLNPQYCQRYIIEIERLLEKEEV